MGCRISRWQERKRGERCRLLICGGRKIYECLSHDWWKAIPLPRGTRPSDVCGKGCTEEEIVVKADGGPRVGEARIPRRSASPKKKRSRR